MRIVIIIAISTETVRRFFVRL